MPNGIPGDHPYTDIVVWNKDTYSPEIANLIREISKIANETTLDTLSNILVVEYDEFKNPDLEKLERFLIALRERIVRAAKDENLEK